MFGLTESQWRDLVLSVNVHRKNRRLSPVDTAHCLATALKQTDVPSLVKALGCNDATTVLKILRLKDLPFELATLVDWGTTRGSWPTTRGPENRGNPNRVHP